MGLRPGYKQTEVGVIAQEWQVRELSTLLEQSRSIRYGIVQPGKNDPRGCLMLRSQDYSNGWAKPDSMHRVNTVLEDQYKNARIRSSDLIMTIVGAGIGQVEIAPPWLDGAILSRSTARIAIDEKLSAQRFIAACLESPIGKRQILNCRKEGAQPVVSCRDLAKFLVPYPSPPEQRIIAGALSDVDALIGALGEIIAKKRDLKQAAMQQLLTGRTRLPGFSGEWGVKRLGEVVRIEKGSLITEKDVMPGPIPVMAGGKKPAYFHNRANRTGTTITISASGANAGYVALFWTPLFASDCSTISEGSDYSIEFVYFQLLLRQDKIYQMQAGGAQPHIHPADLRPLSVDWPAAPEQSAIAAVLSDMDAELSGLQQRLAKTRAIKQGMMQELLTGRTRLV